MKTKIFKRVFFAALILTLALAVYTARAGRFNSDIEFMRTVTVGTWGPIEGFTNAFTTGGDYTSGVQITNWYRVWGTNEQGRSRGAVTLEVSWVGETNISNAVNLMWTGEDGYNGFAIDYSTNGTLWTNWIETTSGGALTNFIERGSNILWNGTFFTSTIAAMPLPIVPWFNNEMLTNLDMGGFSITNGNTFQSLTGDFGTVTALTGTFVKATITTTPASSNDIVNKAYADLSMFAAAQFGEMVQPVPGSAITLSSSAVTNVLTNMVESLTTDGYTFTESNITVNASGVGTNRIALILSVGTSGTCELSVHMRTNGVRINAYGLSRDFSNTSGDGSVSMVTATINLNLGDVIEFEISHDNAASRTFTFEHAGAEIRKLK